MGGRAGRAEIDREKQVADEGAGGRSEVSRRGGEFGAAVGKQRDDTAGVVRVFVVVVRSVRRRTMIMTARSDGGRGGVQPRVEGGADGQHGEHEHQGHAKRRGEARQQGGQSGS